MADSMCGPSSGAKQLVNFAERDRSLQQDRVGGGANGGLHESFRSSAAAAAAQNGANADFENFQATQAMVNMPLTAVGPAGFTRIGGGSDTQAYNRVAPFVPTTGRGQSQAWVAQFDRLRLTHERPGATMMDVGRAYNEMPTHAVAADHTASRALARFVGPAMHPGMARMDHENGAHFHHQAHHLNQLAFQAGTGMAPYGQAVPNVDQEHGEEAALSAAFDKVFDEVEAGQFQRELQQWMDETDTAAVQDRVFEDAQNEWMREHGPQDNDQPAERPIEADPTAPADATEAQLAIDNALATAALDILASVSDNNSERFRQSNFLELMRRIGAREITVSGDELVEVATGQTVMSRDASEDNA